MQQSDEALFANEVVNMRQMSSAAGLYRCAIFDVQFLSVLS
jgi:hypothetical protein